MVHLTGRGLGQMSEPYLRGKLEKWPCGLNLEKKTHRWRIPQLQKGIFKVQGRKKNKKTWKISTTPPLYSWDSEVRSFSAHHTNSKQQTEHIGADLPVAPYRDASHMNNRQYIREVRTVSQMGAPRRRRSPGWSDPKGPWENLMWVAPQNPNWRLEETNLRSDFVYITPWRKKLRLKKILILLCPWL